MINIAAARRRADWPEFSLYRPHPEVSALRAALQDAHARLRALLAPVEGERMQVPLLPILNPPLWELGHVGWFHEFWVHRNGDFAMPSRLAGADGLYDSARVAHDSRWGLPLPTLEATHAYVDSILADTLAGLDAHGAAQGAPLDDALAYFVQLGVLHQDMHNEAAAYMWQTLAYPAPPGASNPGRLDAERGDLELAPARHLLGAPRGSGFVFDNEKWAHAVDLPAFAIARRPVSNAQFAVFVEAGGYTQEKFWTESGWALRGSLGLAHPRYWRREGAGWSMRRFDEWVPLDPDAPVMHVSAHEADAWCRWAGRRLPAEAEWEHAATLHPEDFPMQRLWEWTASRFAPYPGFSADPYKEYSEPWFATEHRVLRGGSFVTPARLIRTRWRNFYTPGRADFFCGFRSAALR